MSGPLLVFLLLATVAVIFVNGWTDAPNAIATAVSTGAIAYRPAVGLAAVCNLLGIVCTGLAGGAVTDTITAMARFDGGTPSQSVAALAAAMLSIVLFAVAAWAFGIPTSESHALIAALTGSALALGGRSSIDGAAWGKVLWGLLLSVAAGLALGWLLTKLLSPFLGRMGKQHRDRFQVLAAGGMAFLHGAQDGQKFIAVLITVSLLSQGRYHTGPVRLGEHWLILLFCAAVMALGTSVGGKRIIETVGEKMVPLSGEQGVCADLAGGLCLLFATVWGIPMSTTHTKTTAVMGTGMAKRGSLNRTVMGGMLAAWVVTFPVCGLLGYGFARLLLVFV